MLPVMLENIFKTLFLNYVLIKIAQLYCLGHLNFDLIEKSIKINTKEF